MICKKYTCVLDQSGGMISLHMSPFFLGTHDTTHCLNPWAHRRFTFEKNNSLENWIDNPSSSSPLPQAS